MEIVRELTPQILAQDRLILALDVNFKEAKELLTNIGDKISIIKINLLPFIELLHDKESLTFLHELIEQDKQLFLDFKLHDITNTTKMHIEAMSKIRNVKFGTIHGNSDMMKVARGAKNGNKNLEILIVTVLTHLDKFDLQEIYGLDNEISVEKIIRHRVEKAIQYNIDGVISSGGDAKLIRSMQGTENLTIVTPGIRLNGNHDDHKRASTPESAIENGSDYLVVGRPIYNSNDPLDTTNTILRRMQQAFDQKYSQ